MVPLAVVVAWAAPFALAQPVDPPEPVLFVPGGTQSLLAAAGVTAPVEPARAFLTAIRAIHGGLTSGSVALGRVETLLTGAVKERLPGDEVPGLLPADVWEQAVLGKNTPPEQLAGAILADRRAAFLYCGLFTLDEETRAFFAAHPALLTAIHRKPAAIFAAYSRGLAIRGGRMRLPGGETAAAAWEELVGAPAAKPEAFVARLLERDEGKLAGFFDTMGRLDPPHLAFALGPSGAGLSPLYSSVRRFETVARLPFTSWSLADPSFLLERLRVESDGRMAPPRSRGFWQRVMAAGPAMGPPRDDDEQDVTAAWIVKRFSEIPYGRRRSALETLMFAQRRVAGRPAVVGTPHDAIAAASAAPAPAGPYRDRDWLAAVSAFARCPALLLTMEELQFVLPVDYERAAGAAEAITAGTGGLQASLRLAVFQSAIGFVRRMALVGGFSLPVAQDHVRDLFLLASTDHVRYPLAMSEWLRRAVLDKAPPPPADGLATGLEATLIGALAGAGGTRPTPVIEWEGRSYRVDLAAGERTRIERLRQKQGGTTVDSVLALGDAVARLLDPSATQAEVEQAAAQVIEVGGAAGTDDQLPLFGFRVSDVRADMVAAARATRERPGDARSDGTKRRLAAGLELLLADVLTSFTYAVAIGDADIPLARDDSPAASHLFGLDQPADRGPWSFAGYAEQGRASSSSALSGSLLALERALARYALLPTTVGLPVARRSLVPQDVLGLAESVSALNPFRLDDRKRDQLAAALARGRQRILALAGQPGAIDALAERAGVDGVRRRLLRGTTREVNGGEAGATATKNGGRAPASEARLLQYFSLAEVLAIGAGGAEEAAAFAEFGPASRVMDGSLGQHMPVRLAWPELSGRPGLGIVGAQVADLQLRVAEMLAELNLPASLMRGVLASAMWELTLTVQVADSDDWLAVMREAQALSADRVTDCVAALVAGGPLVAVRKGES